MPIADVTKARDAPQLFFRDALPRAVQFTIFTLLSEVAQRRPLTRNEIHLRCVVRPRPWQDAGCDPSTYYRRKKRERLAAEAAQAPIQ
jgi:hypothetical protein